MRRLLALVLLGLLPLANAHGAGLQPDPAEGKRLAKQWCNQCHLVEEGAPTAADAGPPFTALANDPDKTESVLRSFLHHPEPPMPPIQLTKREIDNLVAYIRSLADETLHGDAAAGRRFAETNCARCHAIGAEGDSPFTPAPPFRDLAQKWQPEFLAEAFAEGIVVGHPAMPAFELNPQEIADLIAYLNGFRGN